MSYDVYFLTADEASDAEREAALMADADDEELEDLSELEAEDEAAEGSPLSAEQKAVWAALEPRLRALLPTPEAETQVSDQFAQLLYEPWGLIVSCFPEEFALTVPYWVGNPSADVIATMTQLAREIEGETGLVAWDPQTAKRFLGSADEATASLKETAEALAEILEVADYDEDAGADPRFVEVDDEEDDA